jgi:hypothetical protein
MCFLRQIEKVVSIGPNRPEGLLLGDSPFGLLLGLTRSSLFSPLSSLPRVSTTPTSNTAGSPLLARSSVGLQDAARARPPACYRSVDLSGSRNCC